MQHLKHALWIAAALALALALAGCATVDSPSSNSLGCIFGRVTQKASPECATTTVAPTQPSISAEASAAGMERFAKLQAVLDQEIEFAKAVQEDVVSSMQYLPIKLRSSTTPVQLRDVSIGDSKSGQTRTMRALDAITVQMPLAAKGRPEYTKAMAALKNLANRLADNRGSASILVHQSTVDIQGQRVNTSTGVSRTSQGSPVTVQKIADPLQTAGNERYTIQAGPIRGQL